MQQVAAQEDRVPQLFLNGPEQRNYTATFTEDKGPQLIVGPNLTVIDPDSTQLRSATIRLENKPDGAQETLTADTSGTKITTTYNPDSGSLRLRNADTITNYQKVLRTLSYVNLSNAPNVTDRTVTFVVSDGTYDSETVTSTVTINAVNDAPVLNPEAVFRLPDINEDSTTHPGQLISALLETAAAGGIDPITDADANALEGFAVMEAASANGTWQYSTDAGLNWLPFGAVSNESAVLLNTSARIRFLPAPNYSGQASFMFRAWDQTSGQNGQTGVDVSVNGGSSAFSSATGSAVVNVLPVNDPPLLDLNGPRPGTGYSTSFVSNSGPIPILAADATLVDVDHQELLSATITLIPRPDGTAELLAADPLSSTIMIQPYDAATGKLTLTGMATVADYQSVLRTLTYNNTADPPTPGNRTVNFVLTDGVSTSPVVSSTIAVRPENTAPVVDPAVPLQLPPVTEDETDIGGASVGEILAAAPQPPISDADEDALRGLAAVGTDDTHGAWQYSLDAGATWQAFGIISDTAAVLLDTTALLRFVPAPDFSGVAGGLTVRAWDQTSGAGGNTGVDVSTNGGVTAFSSETTTITAEVLPVNDAPQLALPADLTAVFTEDDGPVVIAGPSLSVTDVDSGVLASATVRVENFQPSEPDVLSAMPNGAGISAAYDDATGVLRLSGSAPIAAYQAVLRTVTFENRSQDPDPADRIIAFSVNDGQAESNVVSSTVVVQPVNDPPVVDLNGTDRPGYNLAVAYQEGGNPVAVAPALDLLDVDNTNLRGATVRLLERPDGAQEGLQINKLNTNIVISEDPTNGLILLSGLDSVVNYERVLRTLTYSNQRAEPDRSDRSVQIIVFDGTDESVQRRTTIVIRPLIMLLPVVAYDPVRTTDEPNDTCAEAFPLRLDQVGSFGAEDRDDWYVFDLPQTSNVRIELTNFLPQEGQMLVASGVCGQLTRIGQNGDFAPTKVIELDALPPGRYYIWVITDGPRTMGVPYNLVVRTR